MTINAPPPPNITSSIIHKIYEFYTKFYTVSLVFPKKDRYSLGVKIEQNILELLELTMLAQTKSKQSKILILNKADLTLKIVKLMVRLAYDVKAINQVKYIDLEERLLEIGKMLGGWIKSENTKPTA